MLPQAYELPAAILLVIGGVIACFAGYRLFRIVLAVYGFILGAMITSSMMGASNTTGMLLAAVLGGVVGAVILVFAYFVGIAVLGAGLGALVTHLAWQQTARADPPALAIIVASVIGGILAMILQRYVIIVATAFGGAWTTIVGALAAAGERAAPTVASTNEAWILYPLNPAPGEKWLPFAWAALGVIGTAVQLGLTGRKR
jgi:hypothetical protein